MEMLGNSMRVCWHSINDSCIILIFYLSYFIVILCNTSKVSLYLTHSKNLEKCNKELLYRLLTLFVLLSPGKLRLLLVLFLFIYIWTSLVVVIRWEQCSYLLIILSSYYSNTTYYLLLDKVTLKDSKNQELYCRC